jgi:Tfp pilus assembly protein PilX
MATVDTRKPATQRLGDEQGIALIIALLCMLLLAALGMALTLTTVTERRIATNYRDGVETVYAADAGVERVIQDLLTVPDWNRILDGTTTSSFVDGAPGMRTLPDGSQLNLLQATNVVRCGKTTCSDADIDTATDERPLGQEQPAVAVIRLRDGPGPDPDRHDQFQRVRHRVDW